MVSGRFCLQAKVLDLSGSDVMALPSCVTVTHTQSMLSIQECTDSKMGSGVL